MAGYRQNYPSHLLEEATGAIGSLPGIGTRSALRLALHLLKQPAENVHHFTEAINKLRDEACYCSNCLMISDGPECAICADKSRDHRQICVVESVRDVLSIENTGQYHGVYHVLGGIISPIDGVGPSDITVSQLYGRLEKMIAEGIPADNIEVIMALSGDVEGETTAFYIYRQIEKFGVRVSALARGLGFGDDLEYADELTLGRSILNRRDFQPE